MLLPAAGVLAVTVRSQDPLASLCSLPEILSADTEFLCPRSIDWHFAELEGIRRGGERNIACAASVHHPRTAES